MRFRLFILRDPEAENRGYSFAGIKVPLTTFSPVAGQATRSYDGSLILPGHPYQSFWEVPACLLMMADPKLRKHLSRIENVLVPVEWCDVAPEEGKF